MGKRYSQTISGGHLVQMELIIESDNYRQLMDHLARDNRALEEAAFLFCGFNNDGNDAKLLPVEMLLLSPEAFVKQFDFHLELRDDVRASLIKRAHDLKCCLVEIHSHTEQLEAEFSWSDLRGFEEFVPHVRWRLKGRPYVAVVYAKDSFDALVWQDQTNTPDPLAAIIVGPRRLEPTNNTLSRMRITDDRESLRS